TVLLISLGAILGANLRYFLAQYVTRLVPTTFPLGTLIINISASFILGFFLIWTSERVLADPRWRILIAVGFCGGYSTYSSYAFETFALFEKGQFWLAGLHFALTNAVCFAGAVRGASLPRPPHRPRERRHGAGQSRLAALVPQRADSIQFCSLPHSQPHRACKYPHLGDEANAKPPPIGL